jgi:2-keto-4-pentenoate hydratase
VAVSDVDPRLVSALSIQLGQWRAMLGAGAERVGWKLGVGDRERIGTGPAIGHLTSATRLEPGAVYRADGVLALHADAEVGLRLRRDVDPDCDGASARDAIAGFGAALELVDLAAPPDDPHGVVAANVFHRAFALGPLDRLLPRGGVDGRLVVNGEVRAAAAASQDFADLVRTVARLLGAVGERLQAGDCLIAGSVVQLPLERGDEVIADFGALGRTHLAIAP